MPGATSVVLAIGQPGTRPRSSSRDKEDLAAVVSDFSYFCDFFRKDRQADVLAGSVHDAELSRAQCLQKLRRAFQELADVHIIAYFGHGQEQTGDWQMSDGLLCFEDLLQAWQERALEGSGISASLLLVYLDSCYSGAWVEKAQRRVLLDVFIQASCNTHEVSVDGRFTPLWIEFQGGCVPASVASCQLAPYNLARLQCLRKRNQHPQVYRASTQSIIVGGLPLRFLDDGALSLDVCANSVVSGSPWWKANPAGTGEYSPNEQEHSASEQGPSRSECVCVAGSGIAGSSDMMLVYLDPEGQYELVERICEECFTYRPFGMTPADLIYLYDAFDSASATKEPRRNPLDGCSQVALNYNAKAAASASPHRAVYARSAAGDQEVLIFNHRHPRGVMEPPRERELLDCRQGPLLALYADLGTIMYDGEVEYTAYLGPYKLRRDAGMAVLRLVAGRNATRDFAAEVLRAVTAHNRASAHVPYPPFFGSDQGCGRVCMFMAYIASSGLADVYRSAGYEIRTAAPIRELWPMRPPDGPWWQCHGASVPAEPFLAIWRVEP